MLEAESAILHSNPYSVLDDFGRQNGWDNCSLKGRKQLRGLCPMLSGARYIPTCFFETSLGNVVLALNKSIIQVMARWTSLGLVYIVFIGAV